MEWRAYTGMLSGVRNFIAQMTKMVGPEPLESSHGNVTLLPTYIVSVARHHHYREGEREILSLPAMLAVPPTFTLLLPRVSALIFIFSFSFSLFHFIFFILSSLFISSLFFSYLSLFPPFFSPPPSSPLFYLSY